MIKDIISKYSQLQNDSYKICYYSNLNNMFKYTIATFLKKRTMTKNKMHILIDVDCKSALSFFKKFEKNFDISLITVGKYNKITDNEIYKYYNTNTKLVIFNYSNSSGIVNDINGIINFSKSKNINTFCFINQFELKENINLQGIDIINLYFYNQKNKFYINLFSNIFTHIINDNFNEKIINKINSSVLDIINVIKPINKQKSEFTLNYFKQIMNVISDNDFLKTYSQSLINTNLIVFESNISYNLPISFFSLNHNFNFKNLNHPNIIIPKIISNKIDDNIKKGYMIIDFRNINKKADVINIIKLIVSSINSQYPNFVEEIKSFKKNIPKASHSKCVSFNKKLKHFTNTNFKKHNPNPNKIKSILKKKSKYRI